MSIKFYLYIFIVPITIWTLISINLEKYFKGFYNSNKNILLITYILNILFSSKFFIWFLYSFTNTKIKEGI